MRPPRAQALFCLVEAEWRDPPDAPLPPAFRLAATYPRRVLRRPSEHGVPADAPATLEAAGLVGRQEALFVELGGE